MQRYQHAFERIKEERKHLEQNGYNEHSFSITARLQVAPGQNP